MLPRSTTSVIIKRAKRKTRPHMEGSKMPRIGHSRYFGGHEYNMASWHIKKSLANNSAKHNRKAGWLARVVPNGQGYAVYTRHK